MGYSGQGYFGMQRNQQYRTIEQQLFKALFKADLASEEECDNPHTMFFQRAARTDKSVSAAKQIVSLKLCKNILTNCQCQSKKLILLYGYRHRSGNY